MKPVSSALWGMGTTVVYLLDDRIEVGVIATAYSEELRRVSYRDVRDVVLWRTRRPRFLFLGGLFVACGIGLAIAVVLAGSVPAAIIFGGLLTSVGALYLFLGRDGSVLQFRVESGVRGSVQGVITGRRTKQDRFVKDLVARIEERTHRVPR